MDWDASGSLLSMLGSEEIVSMLVRVQTQRVNMQLPLAGWDDDDRVMRRALGKPKKKVGALLKARMLVRDTTLRTR
jgi:hypothetical protein